MSDTKAELRRAIKARLSRMSENDRRVESQIIVRELRKLLPPQPVAIALYSPYLDEPDITPLTTELLEQKTVICIGKVDGKRMVMHRIRSIAGMARNPVSNIVEPSVDDPIDESTISIAIIPGRAFTKAGIRIGRGNGGYDRWLEEQKKRNPAMKTIGVCFECQLLQTIPVEAHDQNLDEILTPSGRWTKTDRK